jgi:hypothetical protein
MRKRAIRNGLRMVLAAVLVIVVASFYHGSVSDFLSLSYNDEMRLYRFEIFIAAALGSYGVVLSVLGLVLSARQSDVGVRIIPSLFLIVCAVSLFFYLL